MRKLNKFEKLLGAGLLLFFALGAFAFWWVLRVAGNPVALRNESGVPVRVVPLGATQDEIVLLPLRRPLAGGGLLAPAQRTEIHYESEQASFCWLLILGEPAHAFAPRMLKTNLPEERCTIQPGPAGRPCCSPPHASKDVLVIPELKKLPPAPEALLRAVPQEDK